jgi:hypothetical protein
MSVRVGPAEISIMDAQGSYGPTLTLRYSPDKIPKCEF